MGASNDSQPTAQEPQAPRRPRPWRRYAILALVLIAVISLLYARWVGGRAEALNAENKAKVEWVTGYLAEAVTADAERARSEIVRGNAGRAQDALRRADDALAALQRVALKRHQKAASASVDALRRVQEALQQGEQGDAQEAMDDLIKKLGPLTPEPGG